MFLDLVFDMPRSGTTWPRHEPGSAGVMKKMRSLLPSRLPSSTAYQIARVMNIVKKTPDELGRERNMPKKASPA